MSTDNERKVFISLRASDAAFRAGQRFEQLLTDSALEAARNQAVDTVTIDQLKACLDEALLRRLREEVLADLASRPDFERRNAA